MPGSSENINNIGFEAGITGVIALAPQVIDSNVAVLSDGINTDSYPRARILLVAQYKETTPSSYTMTFTVTECATVDGIYAAATVSGTLTGVAADAVQWASIKRNVAKPFIKITATGSNADIDGLVSAEVLFINQGV